MLNLLHAKTINQRTPVWQEGMPHWRELGETALAPHISTFMLSNLMQWWLISCFLILPVCCSNLFAEEVYPLLRYGNYAIFYCLFFILTYQFWQIIQDGTTKVTPKKALWFLFIPFFNIYWYYRVYFGFSLDINRYIARHIELVSGSKMRKTHPLYSLILSILVTGTMSFRELAAFIPSLKTFEQNSSLLFLDYFLLIFFFMAVTFIDFYLSTRSILNAEEQSSQARLQMHRFSNKIM